MTCLITQSTYAGTGGYPITIYAKDATSRIDMYERTLARAPQGAPPLYQLLVRVALTGSVPRYLVLFLADIHNKYHPLVYRHLVFYTAKGVQAVNASTQTTLFALPNMHGMYLISVWASGSGTNYSSTQLAMYDGSLTITPLKKTEHS